MTLPFSRVYYEIRYFFGAEMCPFCGSVAITKRGFAGVNLRWECRECGELMWR